MVKNELLFNAIGNEQLQTILGQIHSISIGMKEGRTPRFELEPALIRARSHARGLGLDLPLEEILQIVENAKGEELDIILGRYTGEIPVIE